MSLNISIIQTVILKALLHIILKKNQEINSVTVKSSHGIFIA